MPFQEIIVVTTRGHFYWDITTPTVLLIVTGGVASRPSKDNAVTKARGTVIGHFVLNPPPLSSCSWYWRLIAHLLTEGAGPMEAFSKQLPLWVFVKPITRQVDFQHCWLAPQRLPGHRSEVEPGHRWLYDESLVFSTSACWGAFPFSCYLLLMVNFIQAVALLASSRPCSNQSLLTPAHFCHLFRALDLLLPLGPAFTCQKQLVVAVLCFVSIQAVCLDLVFRCSWQRICLVPFSECVLCNRGLEELLFSQLLLFLVIKSQKIAVYILYSQRGK